MDVTELLVESHGRVGGVLHRAVGGLDVVQLTWRAGPQANTIAWLAWHAARGEDAQIADVTGTDQVWSQWADRFALPFGDEETGYGQSSTEVGQVEASAELLLGYYDATAARTAAYLRTLSDAALDRVVDVRWDPPVTLGVRLVSIIGDSLQHAGQASFVRGLLERAT